MTQHVAYWSWFARWHFRFVYDDSSKYCQLSHQVRHVGIPRTQNFFHISTNVALFRATFLHSYKYFRFFSFTSNQKTNNSNKIHFNSMLSYKVQRFWCFGIIYKHFQPTALHHSKHSPSPLPCPIMTTPPPGLSLSHEQSWSNYSVNSTISALPVHAEIM